MADDKSFTYVEEREKFLLRRDKILLAVGVFGLLGIGGAAIVTTLGDSAVILALITVFGGLLGLPTMIRLDEARERKKADQ